MQVKRPACPHAIAMKQSGVKQSGVASNALFRGATMTSQREQLETTMRQAIAAMGYTEALRLISEMIHADSTDHLHDADEDDSIEDGSGDESRAIACDLADFANEVGDLADRYETWVS